MTKLAKVSGNVEFVHDERCVLLKQTYGGVGQWLMVLEDNHFEEEDLVYSSTLFVCYIFLQNFFASLLKSAASSLHLTHYQIGFFIKSGWSPSSYRANFLPPILATSHRHPETKSRRSVSPHKVQLFQVLR